MFYSDIDCLREQINKLGALHRKFIFIIDYELSEGYIMEAPLNQKSVLFDIVGCGSNVKYDADEGTDVDWEVFGVSREEYIGKFNTVMQGLKRGDSFLVNLTMKTRVKTNLSLTDIFYRSNARYKLCIPDRFVCFSPERFVKIEDGIIFTNPMKGTIDASIPNAEEEILNDFKETAEHNTIVDLLRNDLSMVSSNVRVDRFRYIDKIKTGNKNLLQVSSQISGRLNPGYCDHIGDIIIGMLPAGSICGAPKAATVRLIHEAEKEPRGFYTGVFGFFDGKVLDSAVMIRYIEKQGDVLYYRSGGGITAYSNCDAEYNEMLDKIYLPFV